MFFELGQAIALMFKTAGDSGAARAYNSRMLSEPEAVIEEAYLNGFREAMGQNLMMKEAAAIDQLGMALGMEIALKVFGGVNHAR